MLYRAMARNNGAVDAMPPGNRPLAGLQIAAIDGDAQAITVAAIIAGVVNRTGTTANTADTFPSADALVAALPELDLGDTIEFDIRMNLAHTETLTLGTGVIAGTGTLTIAASSVRKYLLTLLSGANRSATYGGTTTNGSAVLTNLTSAQLKALSVGMGVTGTGVPASSYITSVNHGAATVTINANCTATADNIAFSFFPRFSLSTLGTWGI